MYRVLIVESRRSRAAVPEELRRAGFQVTLVRSPESALPILRGPVLPDAVLLDFLEPGASELRLELRRHPRLGIVDLGANHPGEEMLLPFSPYKLAAAVRTACEAGGLAQEGAASIRAGASRKTLHRT